MKPSSWLACAASACALAALPFSTRAAEPVSPAAILQDLHSFGEWGSVLYIAAHPDDENTHLIAYLARGRNYRTAYLSVTRGDGGQNVLGSDFDEKLGVARTQELLAARRLDGGRQFFTRAIDFGFSKDYRETLNMWDRQEVVSDMVRIVRTFRPDVLVTRFSPQPGGTHGHHTASAVLGIEAFKLAADPAAFPEQLKDLSVWQPKRIVSNGRGGGSGETLRLEISGIDPVTGYSFIELAGRSRAMHKTQGFADYRGDGSGSRTETFQLLAGEPASNDIMDGIDTTWNRIPGGGEIGALTEAIITSFKSENPAASVPALLNLRTKVAALTSSDPVLAEKREQLDRILQACLGLRVETTIEQPEVIPGETLPLRHAVTLGSEVPVRWIACRYPLTREEVKTVPDLRPHGTVRFESARTLPKTAALSQPYWLRQKGSPGMFHVEDPKLIGVPENPPAFPVEYVFDVAGQTLVVADEPAKAGSDGLRRRLEVIPPVSLRPESDVTLFTPGSTRAIEIQITAARANTTGALRLEAPSDWKIEPASHPFRLAQAGESAQFKFTVTAPARSGSTPIIASAEIDGARYRQQRVEVRYDHLPPQVLQPLASVNAVSLDLAIRGRTIGYLPGAGDSTAENLRQMGYTVKTLSDDDLDPERLRGLDAVVIGVRAMNVRSDLSRRLPGLFAYVEQGGTVVMQYNRPDSRTGQMTPFNLRVSGERVTDETAAVTFLAPEHPVLTTPNRITDADFAGWVQERGIYFPNQWDERFTPILACGDPGETPLKGGLLVAKHGEGHFVYTGLAFFRQLPAGVPGAYRLFANLVSLGK